MRQPDALDYGLIAAVTALAYVRWPGRHALHERLLQYVDTAFLYADRLFVEVTESTMQYYLVAVVLLVVGFLVLLTEVLPRLSEDGPSPPER